MQPFRGSPAEWNALLAALPMPHILQTWQWAQVKTKYGWQSLPFTWDEGGRVVAAAMLLRRPLPLRGLAARLSVCYIPKGPNLDWHNLALRARVLADLERFARQQGAIFIKMDPDVPLGLGVPGREDAVDDPLGAVVTSDLSARGWQFSADQIQFRNTVLLDLSAPEDGLLTRMKQKTRYNVRLAEKKGVCVRPGSPADFDLLYRMYAETSLRDGFVIRDAAYYHTVWQTFMAAGLAEPLIAEVDGEPVAAVWQFHFAGRAYYIYGMSREAHRDKMPNYLLQWAAMRSAKAQGCTIYDLWGAPDAFDETDRMWGVFRFKEGLGGQVLRTMGAWDYAPNPLWYRLYTQIIPRLLGVMRRRGRDKTRQMLT